jgi:muramidase (phage lysozyme)
MRWVLYAVATIAAAGLAARWWNSSASSPQHSGTNFLTPDADEWPTPSLPTWLTPSPTLLDPDQSTSLVEDLFVSLDPTTYRPANVDADTAARNVRAFLDTIAYAEGANYNTLYGGGTFDSFADHPRQFLTFRLGGRDITSSAAGRYQFLARTWDGLVRKLGLHDFSPASQDAGAIELIRERGALRDVQAGRFDAACRKVAPVWASFPGAGHNQPEKSLTTLRQVYARAGGNLESQA